ncbi:MAG: AzlC family ABC transporter permease [Kiritimatiellae bacterium]|nr:AzlC family ABC transporter permease [Kiritimatiellia bacterium]
MRFCVLRNLRSFLHGMYAGIPIGLGYFAVSFAFGIQARAAGLSAVQAFLLSGTNLTSAGQFAGLAVIQSAGSLATLALTQVVINLRYCLMSCALSQKLSAETPFAHRFLMACGVTDEIFGVSISVRGYLSPYYLYGQTVVAWPGWAFGTLSGALAGNILPSSITAALGMALYGMFVAIVVPAAREDRKVLSVVFAAALLSMLFWYCPILSSISPGTRIILVTFLTAGTAAFCYPMPSAEVRHGS